MLKDFIRKIHLWLGLASGIIVFIVSVTGCIYVFSKEINELIRKDALYAPAPSGETVPLSRLWTKVEAHLDEGQTVGWANIYNDPKKSWVFYSYEGKPDGKTYFSMIDHYISVYVDPYSGDILGTYDEKMDFFNVVKNLHWSLLLATSIGQPIVGWSTLIFVILLITGLVLWWPRSFKSARNLFWIRWKKTTTGQRKNYDLHNVLGFYSTFIALVIAFTGMVWSFKWFQALVYVLAAGTTTPPDRAQLQSTPVARAVESPIDLVFEQTRQRYAQAAGFRVVPAADSLSVINSYVQVEDGLYYKTHELQFDQYSGKLLKERKYEDKNAGERLISANYDIHVGSLWGLKGKILAFLVSLFCASLPITGFYIWWNKRKQRSQSLFN